MYTRKDAKMLALRLPDDIEKRLEALARKTGRTKSFYAREAIMRHLEDLEDAHLASERLKRTRGRVSLEELETELEPGRAILRYLRERIATADDPRRFGKPLAGELTGLWRYRVGDYRLVTFEDDRLIVLVLRVAHRREVYD